VLVPHKFDWKIDYDSLGIWRFSPMLPEFEVKNSLGEGFTPLVESINLVKELKLEKLFFKDEGRNPTGSFRDRVAALITSHAKSVGAKTLVCATDGNTGASLAAYAARLGLRVKAYVPRESDYAKIILMKSLGAEVIARGETLDDVYNYVSRLVEENPEYYNATSEDNPLSIEALKTISLELYMELGNNIDTIIVPVGSGLTLYSIYHGFRELYEHGLIKKIPRLIGVQSCSNPSIALKLGISKKCDEKPIIGLAYELPPLERETIEAIKESKGSVVVVHRKQVIEAAEMLAKKEGLFVEPAAAVALAGLYEAVREYLVDKNDSIVLILTGHGLKAYEAYFEATRKKQIPSRIFPKNTKMEIIRLLYEKEGLHGYSVWRELGLKVSVQAIYQHLNELERKGIVYSRVIGGKKHYYLTSKGKRIVELLNELSALLTL